MTQTVSVEYPRNHVEPYRIYLQSSEATYALIDIQIKAELRNLDNPEKQEHSLSIYLKPPIIANYRLYSRKYNIIPLGPGKVRYHLLHEPSSKFYNPYISWHGSGTIHANAYKNKNKKRTERIVADKAAISWRDVVMAPQLVLRAILPVSDISNEEKPLDTERSINLININEDSIRVKKPNSFILDKTKLITDSVMIDVFVHHKAYEIKNLDDIPYPNGSEIILIGPPLKFENSSSIFIPGVSLFIYQPPKDSKSEVEQQPLILNGISRNHPLDDIYIQAILEKT